MVEVDIEVELARGTLRARGTVHTRNAVLAGVDAEGTVYERGSGVRLTLPEGGAIDYGGQGISFVHPGTYTVDGNGELAMVIDGPAPE